MKTKKELEPYDYAKRIAILIVIWVFLLAAGAIVNMINS